MKVVSFNVNGIRARMHQLERLIDKHQPDYICLQEIKVANDEFPVDDINSLGYNIIYNGQKSHYGVAIMSKKDPVFLFNEFGDQYLDEQRRIIAVEDKENKFVLVNGYFPQGESRNHTAKFPYKKAFYNKITEKLEELKNTCKKIIVVGDMNIAYFKNDIGIGEDNAKRWLSTGKCAFLPEELEMLDKIYSLGFIDSYRYLNPDIEDVFSWFDYRSFGFQKEPKRGLRIDLVLVTEELKQNIKDSGIDYEIRGMEKPSDHCPVWIDLQF